MIYYIADTHFGHENVRSFDRRPFSDAAQMEQTLMQNWNARVTEDDIVYVLGDAFWKNEENSIQIMQQLNGHKHLIQGNPDRVKGRLRLYWESIELYAEVNDENRLVILSHYPRLFYKGQHHGAIMLYGHVHNSREWDLVEKWKKEQVGAGHSVPAHQRWLHDRVYALYPAHSDGTAGCQSYAGNFQSPQRRKRS